MRFEDPGFGVAGEFVGFREDERVAMDQWNMARAAAAQQQPQQQQVQQVQQVQQQQQQQAAHVAQVKVRLGAGALG